MANITTQTIRVDLSTDKVIPSAFTHQNDTARTLEFSMYNKGMPYTMTGNTVKFAYKSPIVDGAYTVITGSSMASGTVSGNKVTVTLPSAYTAISGVGMLTMIITPTSGTVRPVNIRLVVQKSADGDDTVMGASDFPVSLYDYMDNWLAENEPTEIANLKSDLSVNSNFIAHVDYDSGHFWYENLSKGNSATARAYNKITVPPGTYYYGNLYAYFSIYKAPAASGNGTRFSTSTRDTVDGSITFTDITDVYITYNTNSINPPYFTDNIDLITKISDSVDYAKYLNPDNSAVYLTGNLLPLNTTAGKFWYENHTQGNDAHSVAYEEFHVPAGTYYYKDIYAYVCFYRYNSNSGNYTRFNTSTKTSQSGILTLTEGANILITVNIAGEKKYPLFTANKIAFDSKKVPDPQDKIISGDELPLIIPTVITVGNGQEYTTVKDAITVANEIASKNTPVEIHIYSGTYDILSELGGSSFLSEVENADGNRNGILLNPFISLIGHGNVLFTYLPDDAVSTYNTTSKASPIEIYGDVYIENIKIRAKNCRYCVHDESNNNSLYGFSKHIYNLCDFEHLGNIDGGWTSCDAIGQGTSNGNLYKYINTSLKSASFYAFSNHNNENQNDGNIYIFDGCTFDGNYNGYSVKFGYYLNNTTKSKIIMKSCNASNKMLICPETNGTHSDVYDVYNYTNILIDRT